MTECNCDWRKYREPDFVPNEPGWWWYEPKEELRKVSLIPCGPVKVFEDDGRLTIGVPGVGWPTVKNLDGRWCGPMPEPTE